MSVDTSVRPPAARSLWANFLNNLFSHQKDPSVAEATLISPVEQIGETAGEVWHLLEAEGPLSVTKLIKQTSAPRDMVLQAIGWLAREDKIVIEEQGRTRTIALRS